MSNSTITKKEEWDAIAAQFYPYFLKWLERSGTSVDEIEEYNSIEGVRSLPARLDLGGVRKNVLVPLRVLTEHTEDSALDARAAAAGARTSAALANFMAEKAETAAQRADAARESLEETKGLVEDACQTANSAAERVNELCSHPPEIGGNKNWWMWNESLGAYQDTGILAEGHFDYSTMLIDEESMHLILVAPKELEEPQFELEEETGHLYLKLKAGD